MGFSRTMIERNEKSRTVPSLPVFCSKRIEYILEGNLLEKSLKRPFCCTVSNFTYLGYITFWALEYHFIENLKLILKPNYEIGWFIFDQ